MAKTCILVGGKDIDVEFTLGPDLRIERFDSVRDSVTGRKINLARRDMHSRVYNAVAENLASKKIEFEAGEDPERVFINEEGLADFEEE